MKLSSSRSLFGTVTVPGDKSVSHRSVMLGALCDGDCHVRGFLNGDDCMSTIACMKALGAEVTFLSDTELIVHGVGVDGLRPTDAPLYTGNSGTTTRLLTGLLAGQSFDTTLSGDASICRRPMGRVIDPLTKMGANIDSNDKKCPLTVHGSPLTGIDYTLPVASAQLKSALLLAGLYAEGETTIRETAVSRDHTERLLRAMGADISTADGVTTIKKSRLSSIDLDVPADISSAAYFLAAGACADCGEVTVKSVGINPTRTGLLDVMDAMGADITLTNVTDDAEPTADIIVRASKLHGTVIGGSLIPRLIDELPIIAVLAAYADGETVIRDASELRHKETDRIEAIADMLRRAGVPVTTTDDGMTIWGKRPGPAHYVSYGDHRMAMSAAILALGADGESTLEGENDVSISFPTFFDTLNRLLGGDSL